MRVRLKISLLLSLVLLASCAVRMQQKNPLLSERTAWELNVADQLRLLEGNYKTFFTDVGIARRSGALNDAQIAQLNAIGNRMKPILEIANRAFKNYQANIEGSTREQVSAALTQATQLFTELYATKTKFAEVKP